MTDYETAELVVSDPAKLFWQCIDFPPFVAIDGNGGADAELLFQLFDFPRFPSTVSTTSTGV